MISLPEFFLEGKVAMITGARRGLGEATALLFARAGADVAICDIVTDDGLLDAVSDKVRKLGRRCLAMKADVTKRAEVQNFYENAVSEFGFIDVLVNNAGVWDRASVLEADDEHWEWIVNTDLKAHHICCQTVCPKML